MSCIPSSYSMTTILSPVESQMEENSGQRRGSRVYQIFPEVNTDEDSETYPDDFMYNRERLPSIVVEPTELSEEIKGEHLLPQGYMGNSVEQQDEEDSTADQTEDLVDGEQQEDTGTEGSPVYRKASIGPSQSQLSLSRLTPPASPTPPDREAAPPSLRS
ncbi:protein LBH [Thalassophryne amazonica]|uniref:protein LBH n=1 Tax=Thalassophryne amazonica TaxID=390379 RepID=UPI0014712293|nr:protein LBH [Thalassophryne amazonica]